MMRITAESCHPLYMASDSDPHAEQSRRTVTPRVRLTLIAVAGLLMLWFLFAWIILDRHVLDAAGESVGTALAIGVIVSLIGALRAPR